MTFVCLINLCGLPFSIGFYIKHLLVLGYNINTNFMYFIYTNIVLGAISGLFYSYRLFYNVFFDFMWLLSVQIDFKATVLMRLFSYDSQQKKIDLLLAYER